MIRRAFSIHKSAATSETSASARQLLLLTSKTEAKPGCKRPCAGFHPRATNYLHATLPNLWHIYVSGYVKMVLKLLKKGT